MGKPHLNLSKDVGEAYFKNGSLFTVEGATDSARGLRRHSIFLDEVRDADEDAVSEIIIPQLNVSRRDARGLVNPHEAVNQQMICGTSAGTKSSYAYSLLCETFIQAIIDPSNAFVMGLDYRLPAKHGLVDGKFVERQKFSSSYNEATFAAEYGGVWQGGSNEAWFDFEKLTKYRKKKNPEWKQVYEETANVFYLVSIDVGENFLPLYLEIDKANSSNCWNTHLGNQQPSSAFTQKRLND